MFIIFTKVHSDHLIYGQMGKKIKIYTKTGDDGTTGLIGGGRVKKYDIRLETYGTIDELNSYLGVIRSKCEDYFDNGFLKKIQLNLFEICSCLATDPFDSPEKELAGSKNLSDDSKKKEKLQFTDDLKELEAEIDRISEELPPLTNFVLPSGCESSVFSHVARTVCRRAERNIVRLSEHIPVDISIMQYINRLSDYLFVLARMFNFKNGVDESFWEKNK